MLAADLGDLLAALDVNPVIVPPGGCVAVDALVEPAAARPDRGAYWSHDRDPFAAYPGAVVLDGGLATELERRGADLRDPLWSARVLSRIRR